MDRFPPLIFIYKIFLLSIVPYKGGLQKKKKKKTKKNVFFPVKIFTKMQKIIKRNIISQYSYFSKNLLNFLIFFSPHLEFFFIW
jgi:hypothetical protein